MKKINYLRLWRSLVGTIALLFMSAFAGYTSVHGADSSASAGYALPGGTNEFGLWLGGSPDSTKFIGNIEDRKLLLFALRYARILAAWDAVSLAYTLDIVPTAVVFEPDRVRRGRSSIYGAGLSPLGFKVNFAQHNPIQPFVAASVGFLYFERDVPVPRSSRFNFTPEIGLGVQLFIAPKRAVTLGYKLHHMSNANTRRRNPGMDSHVLYAGFSYFTP
jgi:hypothetical protein